MRNYVNNHPGYTKNSILPKKVMDDMLITLADISSGKIKDENFKEVFSLWEVDTKGPANCSCC